jgi:antitoxin (DNA-binding transcriptional repressor) of toxin-antitoxin stability system
MERIAISKFKATCLRVLQRVHNTRKPALVTRFGKPVAEIAPAPEDAAGWVICMAGTGKIVGDIVAPAVDETDWEALND